MYAGPRYSRPVLDALQGEPLTPIARFTSKVRERHYRDRLVILNSDETERKSVKNELLRTHPRCLSRHWSERWIWLLEKLHCMLKGI